MAINYEGGPVGPGHAILIRDHQQQQEIKRLKNEVAELKANAFKYGGAAMKRTLIKTGNIYENNSGSQRKVEKISDTPRFKDGYIVTYRIVKGRECGSTKFCTLGAFASWAKKMAQL